MSDFSTDFVDRLDLALGKPVKAEISKARRGRSIIRLKMEILVGFWF